MSKAAGCPKNFAGQSDPVPETIACFLLSSAWRVPISKISVVTAVGPNIFLVLYSFARVEVLVETALNLYVKCTACNCSRQVAVFKFEVRWKIGRRSSADFLIVFRSLRRIEL